MLFFFFVEQIYLAAVLSTEMLYFVIDETDEMCKTISSNIFNIFEVEKEDRENANVT